MLEKHDVRKNRNGRAGGAPPPFSAPTRRGGKPEAAGKAASSQAATGRGLKLRRYFTSPGDDGFAGVEWELRTAAITGENGKSVFENYGNVACLDDKIEAHDGRIRPVTR